MFFSSHGCYNVTWTFLELTFVGFFVCFELFSQFPVLATRAGGYGDEDESAGGRTELASLLERGKVMRLRAALQDETRRSMTYTEFQDLCEDCGMDEADAQQVGKEEIGGTSASGGDMAR